MNYPPQQRFCVNCGQPSQDDPLLTGLAAGYVGSRMGRQSRQRVRQPRSRLRGYGCLLLFLALVFIAMLATRGGRDALSEGCMEGCLDAILGGLLGGG